MDNEKLAGVLKMVEVEIPANSIFVGHGHLQHGGAGWNGGYELRYHACFIPEGAVVKDAVVFVNAASLGNNFQLSWTNEGEASGDICDGCKQGCTNISSDSDPGILR